MSRMADQQMQEDDRENLSGMDDYLAWVDWMERDNKRIEEENDHNNANTIFAESDKQITKAH